MKGHLYVGTSGWKYPWKLFYPETISSKDTLSYYAKHFKTTEVNYSFYHLPKPTTYESWKSQVPEDFLFAVKLSRFITHIKRLRDSEESLRIFLQNASFLGKKLGPILVQLPPNFKINTDCLGEFLDKATKLKDQLNMSHLRFVFEFRHESWFMQNEERDNALSILKKYNAAFVFGHSSKYPYPADEPVTADIVYLRFHGPERLFDSEYGEKGLATWIPKIEKWLAKKLDVYCYFNNTVQEYAVHDAKLVLRKF